MGLPRPHLVDLSDHLQPERIHFFDEGTGKGAALEHLANDLAEEPAIGDGEAFVAAIFERERVSSTGIGNGIAVPHAKLPTIEGFALAVGLSRHGIAFDAKDGEPVRIVVMIAASDQEREAYLRVLATVASILKREAVCDAILDAGDPQEVIAAFTIAEEPG